MEVIFYLMPTDAKQRAHDMAIERTDTSQPVNTCSAHQIHQQGFNRVVTMMGHTDSIGPDILSELFKIAIAQIACSHLNANLMEGSIFTSFKMCQMEGNVQTFT